MKKLLVSFVLVVLFCLSSSAQGLYKVTFSYYDNPIVYDGLLAWYGPAQPSFMRIRFYEPNLRGYVLVEQSVTFIAAPGGYILAGTNPRFLTPVPQGVGYNADSFLFTRCPNGYFPCVAAADPAKGQIGPVGQFGPLTPLEATNVLPAFGFPIANTTYTAPRSITMHLVVVADTDDPDIGRGDSVDAQGIKREFEIAANAIGIRFNHLIISGSSFSRNAVVNTLNGLDPGSNDIVVFAYTGHGFRYDDDDSDPYPRFYLGKNRQSPDGNNLQASEVFNALKRKGARLNITIVDACNSKVGTRKPRYESGVALKASDAGINGRAVATLFLNSRGNIIVASSSEGEKSRTNSEKGGYFIHSFLEAFKYQTSLVNSSTPSWRTIFSNSKNDAYTASDGNQTAIYYLDEK